ncbi:hypothetical protein ABEG17_18560 [Pedococcus sp. KACC 23699]|uniref:Secreted protein n=1 Tax=Pedococcus sp. KACC 23699 TaxID=3149228 RepID=A0AAU7JTF1_9MICO
MKSPTRLAAATGAVLAVVAFGSTAALASGSSSHHDSSSQHESSSHHDEDSSILRAPIDGSQVSDPTLFGAKPGGAPWVIEEGQARLSRSGSLRVEVEGLVIPGRGNPLPTLGASIACGGKVVATTATVPFSSSGDARIRAHVTLPTRCLAPAVLLNPGGNAAVYIAVTGG